MKKIFNIIFDPRLLSVLVSVFFIISLINVNLYSATNFTSMTWWGKLSFIGFVVVIGIGFLRYFIAPAIGWIGELFKKNKK